MWRLSQSTTIPTTFCTDCIAAENQGKGLHGANEADGSYRMLPAVFQCLHKVLGADGPDFAHAVGHSGDAWNDFVDEAAKQERNCSFLLFRQAINMRHWEQALPTPSVDGVFRELCHGQCPVAGKEGFRGKTQLLRDQMRQHFLNFLGIQESRCAEVCGLDNGVLRLGAGSDRGHWGTESRQRYVNEEPLYVLIDANAEPGEADGVCVGATPFPSSKSIGFFREFLATRNLCLPSTFECHSGSTDTWTAPDGLRTSCIDFVCIPVGALEHCVHSQVLDSFDLGNGDIDHKATGLQLQWNTVYQEKSSSSHQLAVDRAAICGVDLQVPLADLVVPDWHTDIESHFQAQNEFYRQCLVQACPRQKQLAKKSFITDEIWTMRNARLTTKKLLQHVRRRQGQEALLFCFNAGRSAPSDPATFFDYGSTLLCWRLSRGVRLSVEARRLKRALRQARQSALAEDLHQLHEDSTANDVLRIVKKHVGSTNCKNLKKKTLPMLLKEDGGICTRPDQVLDR
eukprot:s2333_g4.t1